MNDNIPRNIAADNNIPTFDVNMHILKTAKVGENIKISLIVYGITNIKGKCIKPENTYVVVVVCNKTTDRNQLEKRRLDQKRFKDLKLATDFYEKTVKKETNKLYDKKLCRKRLTI